jgi:hypothetical protein
MKLTMAKLKKLIKEELQRLEEGIPKSVRDASEEGKIDYINPSFTIKGLKYYYYSPAGEASDTDAKAIRQQINDLKDDYKYEDGRYRAVKGGSELEKQIMANLNNPADWKMLRDDDRSMIFIFVPISAANKLIASGDILHQQQG